MTTSTPARLIFSGEHFVSLPKVATIIEAQLAQLGHGTARQTEAALTAMRLATRDTDFLLDIAFENGETVLCLTVARHDCAATDPLAPLAAALYALASQLPARWVVWAGTDLRIPCDSFVAGLAAQFDPDADPDATPRPRPAIEPRRVVSSGVRAPRPLADPTASLLANSLPAVDPAARFTSANRNDRPGTPHHDAHVLCYEHHLRAALLRAADATEIEALRKAQGILPVEARLSTWAVSLAVATVSLPVAAPVMIYNLARGEDMRVASLAMGLAGLFLALDSSGAMAAVTGF